MRRDKPFSRNDSINSPLDFAHGQRRESEPRTPALHRGYNLANVVADDAESHILGVLLNHATQSGLCGCRHHVRLIEDDELVAFSKEGACLSKLLDLSANNVDASIIGCIKLSLL